jgi:hypothetical protein
LGTAAWRVLCCPAGAAHVTWRCGSNMKRMGKVRIGGGSGEETGHSSGTSHFEQHTIFCTFLFAYTDMCLTNIIPVYCLLWQ